MLQQVIIIRLTLLSSSGLLKRPNAIFIIALNLSVSVWNSIFTLGSGRGILFSSISSCMLMCFFNDKTSTPLPCSRMRSVNWQLSSILSTVFSMLWNISMMDSSLAEWISSSSFNNSSCNKNHRPVLATGFADSKNCFPGLSRSCKDQIPGFSRTHKTRFQGVSRINLVHKHGCIRSKFKLTQKGTNCTQRFTMNFFSS